MRNRSFLSEGVSSTLPKCRFDLRHPFVLVGGPPCQDLSIAGRQAGLDGEKSRLWRDYIRVVKAQRPEWIVWENVGHTWRRWVPVVRSELAGLGYASLPLRVRASDLGACHQRSRIFIVAHADCELLRELSRWWVGPGRQVAKELGQSWDSTPRRQGAHDGIPHRMERNRVIGNAVCPSIVRVIARGIKEVNP
jgi:DNA (cytosine-5)-methyltransferase 1